MWSAKITRRLSILLHLIDAGQPGGNQHSTVSFPLKENNNKYGNMTEPEGIKTRLFSTPEKSFHHVMCVHVCACVCVYIKPL